MLGYSVHYHCYQLIILKKHNKAHYIRKGLQMERFVFLLHNGDASKIHGLYLI